jgi:hypothetical protein
MFHKMLRDLRVRRRNVTLANIDELSTDSITPLLPGCGAVAISSAMLKDSPRRKFTLEYIRGNKLRELTSWRLKHETTLLVLSLEEHRAILNPFAIY